MPTFRYIGTHRPETKKGRELGMSCGEGERGEVCKCVSVCIYTQVASRVLTHINFVSIFVLPVVK